MKWELEERKKKPTSFGKPWVALKKAGLDARLAVRLLSPARLSIELASDTFGRRNRRPLILRKKSTARDGQPMNMLRRYCRLRNIGGKWRQIGQMEKRRQRGRILR